MAGLVKYWLSAQPRNLLIQRLRALNFNDSDLAGMLGQNFAPEKNHQSVAPDNLSAIVNDPNPISIPIQPDAHVRMFPAHCGDEITQVLRLNRIGMVMRKPGIRVAVQPDEIDAEILQDLGRHKTGSAIPAVRHDPQPAGT